MVRECGHGLTADFCPECKNWDWGQTDAQADAQVVLANGNTDIDRIDRTDINPWVAASWHALGWVRARFESRCVCGLPIKVGDFIRCDEEGNWRCC